ncbi:MAG: response regulator, partial [Ekhidna sp.]|nr:response regulator [Ekhidna sp.]
YYELFGITQEEVKEITFEWWSQLVHPEDRDNSIQDLTNALQGNDGYYATTFRIFHPDGKLVYIKADGMVLRDEQKKPIRVIGTTRDVTEERTREMELKRARDLADFSSKRFQTMFNEAPLGIALIDSYTGVIYEVNPKFAEIAGRTVEQMMNIDWMSITHPDDVQEDLDNMKLLNEGKIQGFNMQKRYITPEKEYVWISMTIAPVNVDTNESKRHLCMIENISERKQKESELKHAKEKAEQASIAKSEFLANMSHEIRTPLNSMIGFSELLMQTELAGAQEDYMSSVNHSANALLDLINDILDFSKIEAGKLELEIEQIDLHALVNQIIDIVKYRIEEKEIELLFHLDSHVPRYIHADSIRLKQVLVNLLGNAIKFTESGEVELSITQIEKVNDDGQSVLRFEVRDTGIGISEDQQEAIFEAFSQEDTSTTRKYGGTGLGLSISNQLLSLMHSSLQLTSTQGIGSLFHFDINVQCEDEVEKEQVNVQNISKLLLVDDNARSRDIIKDILTQFNIKVEVAKSGHEGLEKIEKNWTKYDVILLDHLMPEISGEEVVVKMNEILPPNSIHPPLVLMCNSFQMEVCQELRSKYQISSFLDKPITRADLLNVIASIADGTKNALEDKIEVKATSKIDFGGKSLLVVDDNTMNRRLARSMFNELFENITIMEGKSGEIAIDLVEKHTFDLILMDVQMPGMSGYQTTRSIRKSNELNKEIPIIALTAGTLRGEKARCIAAGMNDYLSKPVTIEKLMKIVKKWTKVSDEGMDLKSEMDALQESENPADRHVFNYDRLLKEFRNNHQTVERLLETVRAGILEQQLASLKAAFRKEDNAKEIGKIAHTIKGTFLTLYFEVLEDKITQLEELNPNFYGEQGSSLMKEIDEGYQAVFKIISDKSYL